MSKTTQLATLLSQVANLGFADRRSPALNENANQCFSHVESHQKICPSEDSDSADVDPAGGATPRLCGCCRSIFSAARGLSDRFSSHSWKVSPCPHQELGY